MGLTFPLGPDGLVADVLVNLTPPALVASWRAGVRLQPLAGRALIDTGADVTGVSAAVLRRLGSVKIGSTKTQGVGGSVAADIHEVTLSLRDAADPNRPWLTHPALIVLELDPSIGFDALIGLNVLRSCRLFLDGPAGFFTIDH